jgi:nucleoside-diphosphate-sugar epimerase
VFYGHGATLRTMLSLLKKRQLPVPRDAGGVLSYAHLSDAAAASVAALERGRPGHAYTICDDEPTHWAAFIDAATRTFGLPRAQRVPGWLFKVTPYAHLFLTWRHAETVIDVLRATDIEREVDGNLGRTYGCDEDGPPPDGGD